MKTSHVTREDIARSVLAVPPLARHADLSLNREANAAQIRHLETGGVTSLLYGGNANFYNIASGEYASVLDTIEAAAAASSWVIPSIGPDHGRMMDQVAILRGRDFPTAMALPQSFPTTPAGVEAGLRRVADAYGRPLIVYVKAEGYLAPAQLGALVADGLVCMIKYAIARPDTAQDPYLTELLQHVDRALVVSGMGERPAPAHLRGFGLAGFTSGSVCIAPRSSNALLAALRSDDAASAERLLARFLPLEDLRDGLSQIRVMHEAVSLAGVAPMGPMLPTLSNIEPEHHAAIREAARTLLAADREAARLAA